MKPIDFPVRSGKGLDVRHTRGLLEGDYIQEARNVITMGRDLRGFQLDHSVGGPGHSQGPRDQLFVAGRVTV